jgi:hypothetical protein
MQTERLGFVAQGVVSASAIGIVVEVAADDAPLVLLAELVWRSKDRGI